MELYKTSEYVVVDREDIKLILRFFFSLVIQKHN